MEIQNNITGLNDKIENEGVTSRGRLSAPEFNLLVNAVIESQKYLQDLDSYFIPISETEYEYLLENGELVPGRPYFIYED